MIKKAVTITDLAEMAKALPRPSNYFTGQMLPEAFELPRGILVFCHDVAVPAPDISSRYMLILPLTGLTYHVEDHCYDLSPGHALLVDPFLTRSVPPTHRSYLRLMVSFELRAKQPFLPETPLCRLNAESLAHLGRMLGYYRRERILECTFELTLLLQALSRNPVRFEQKQVTYPVTRAMHYINQNLGSVYSIKGVADKVGLSGSHLRRLFREEMGISLGEYVRRLKLNSAMHLLQNTDYKIRRIAAECGYDSIYAFSHFFKKQTGESPVRFRRSTGGEPPVSTPRGPASRSMSVR